MASNHGDRLRLWQDGPHCHWCGRITRLVDVASGQQAPPDQATVDHIYVKHDPRRRSLGNPRVLACNECNQRRALDVYRAALVFWAEAGMTA